MGKYWQRYPIMWFSHLCWWRLLFCYRYKLIFDFYLFAPVLLLGGSFLMFALVVRPAIHLYRLYYYGTDKGSQFVPLFYTLYSHRQWLCISVITILQSAGFCHSSWVVAGSGTCLGTKGYRVTFAQDRVRREWKWRMSKGKQGSRIELV